MATARRPKVVVVGAGIAGVGAAGALLEGGISNVILLEAADQPGGRVQSIELDDGFVELGAQYFHGKHEFFHFAEQEGMLLEEDSDDEELPDTLLQYSDWKFRTSDGAGVKRDIIVNNLKVLEKLQVAAMAVSEKESATDVNVSVGQYYRDAYPTYRRSMAGSEDLKTAMIRFLEDWECPDSGATVDQMSLPGAGRYIYVPGNGTRETTKGMAEVLKRLLAKTVPPKCLRLNKAVSTIYWQDPPGNTKAAESSIKGRTGEKLTDDSADDRTIPDHSARIECKDGEKFYADHVIVTPSVGFLRENHSFFTPPLPDRHQKAVDTMGFGNVAKMFLFWSRETGKCLHQCCDPIASWQKQVFGIDVEGMVPLWLEGVQPEIRSAKYNTKMSNGRHWYEEVCLFEVIRSHDFCIIAWVGGEAAIVMESLPELEVKDVLHELLALFLGKPDLPPPCQFIRTQWYTNPYTRGSYSYLATGVPLELHEVLSHPLPSMDEPVVQLAGEACSKHYYSTLHGALQSGRDAAQVILRHHNLGEKS